MKKIDGIYEIAKELQNDTGIDISNCYHRVVQLCEGIMEIDRFEFDLSLFSGNELKEFLLTYISILESDCEFVNNIYKAQQSKKYPNKKMSYRLSKEDVDNSLDELMKKFLWEGYLHSQSSFCPNLDFTYQKLQIDLAKEKNMYRSIIRKSEALPLDRYLNSFNHAMGCLSGYIDNALNYKQNGYLNLLESLYALYQSIEAFADIIMQTVLYLIIDNNTYSKEVTLEKLDLLRNECAKIGAQFKPRTEWAEKKSIYNSFAVYLMYLNFRNSYRNEIEVQSILSLQMENAIYKGVVEDNYQCKQRYLEDIETKNQLMDIVLEGKKEKVERFNKNMDDVKHLIVLLDTITGRELSAEYVQHLKVVYREIIEDSLEYNGKQSRTIMRNIEKKDIPYFESVRETIFIREKISRGLMREKGYSEEYVLKNSIQKMFYESILSCFSSYDELRIAKDLRRLMVQYKKTITKVLE